MPDIIRLVSATYEKSSIEVDEYARRVINYSNTIGEINKRENIRKRLRFLEDAWKSILRAEIEGWVRPSVADAVLGVGRDHVDISRNPAKRIWKELAVVYNYPPIRKTEQSKSDAELYEKILEGTDFNLWWQLVELYLVSCNEVVIWPEIITRNGKKKIKHRVAAGNTVTIIPSEDDITEIECVLIHQRYRDIAGDENIRHHLWTDSWYAQYQEKKVSGGNQIELERVGFVPDILPESDSSAKNPYGTIPMVHIRMTPWQDKIWDCTSGDDLIDLTVNVGIENLFFRYLQKMSGFKSLIVSGDAIDDFPETILDPGSILALIGSNVSVQQMDWQLDLRNRQEIMTSDEIHAAAGRGINAALYQKNSPYQGSQQAQLAERGIARERIKLTQILAGAEARYKKIFCIVAKAHGLENVPDENVPLEVQYAPLQYPEDPRSQIEIDKEDLSLGIESHITLLQKREPGLTRKQAAARIKRNWEDISTVQDLKVTRNIPDNPSTQSLSAESNGQLGGKPPVGSRPTEINSERGNYASRR